MHNKEIKIALGIIFILALIGCGGGGGSDGGEVDTPPTVINMVIGQSYSMKKGQTIVRKVEPSKILIDRNMDTGESTAKLVSGAAEIK